MKNKREQELISRLSIVRKLSLAEAMELLGISESTARRMFSKLEKDGLAIRTHGGVRCLEQPAAGYSFERGIRINIAQKTAIAAEACKFLSDGDVIFCDSGTTIQCFCAELVKRLLRERLDIRVYTNSLANLELLAPYLPVHLVGGEYRANRKDFCGYMAEQALSGLYFTKSFVGADGCVRGEKFTTTDFDTMRMNEIALENSQKTFMLVDSSKFGLPSHVVYATVRDIHTVITDDRLDPVVRESMESAGARVICAG